MNEHPTNDQIFLLKPAAGQLATKRFSLKKDGSIGKNGALRASQFFTEVFNIANIRDLHQILENKQRDPFSFAIRGGLKEGFPQGKPVLRRIHDQQNQPAPWTPQARRWVCLDLDSLTPPPGIDPISDPHAAAQWAVGGLPEVFHNASFSFQFSSSQSVPKHIDQEPANVLKLHLWFWLDRPISDEELKAFFPIGSIVDRSLFNGVQPHFTGAPIFGPGLSDPLPIRSGFVDGEEDFVTLPAIVSTPQAIRTEATSGKGGQEARGFENIISTMGDGPGLAGFHDPIMRSTASYIGQHGAAGTDVVWLKSRLREAIQAAPRSPTRHPGDLARYASDKFLDEQIQGALAKFGQPATPPTVEGIPPEYPEIGKPVAEIDAPLKAAIEGFFSKIKAGEFYPEESEHNLLCLQEGIQVDMAGGKTEAALQCVVEAVTNGFNGIFFVPQHKLSEDILTRLGQLMSLKNVAVWKGYDRPDANHPGEKMCRYAETVTEVIRAGGVIEDYCGSGKGACQFKPGNDGKSSCGIGCGYWRQKAEKGKRLWIMPSNMLAKKKPKNVANPNFIIIDEDFSHFMIHGDQGRYSVTRAEMLEPRNFPPNKHIPPYMIKNYAAVALSRVQAYLDKKPEPGYFSRSGLWDEPFKEACQKMEKLEWLLKKDIPKDIRTMPFIQQCDTLESISKHNSVVKKRARFWQQLSRFFISTEEQTPYLHWNGSDIRLCWKDSIHGDWNAPTLYMDGTLCERIVKQWLPNLLVTAKIKIESTHVNRMQVIDKPFSQSAFVPDPKNSHFATQQNNATRIDHFLEVKANQYRGKGQGDYDVLVIGQKGLIDHLKSEHEKNPSWDSGRVGFEHFNNLRGVDKYKGVRAQIQIGRTLPSPAAVEFQASIITGRVIEPLGLDANGKTKWYPKRLMGVRMADGSGLAVEGVYHPDVDAEAVRWATCEAELVQSEARARGNRRTEENPLDVFLLSNVCLPLTIHKAITYAEAMAEGVGVRLMAARGIIPGNWRGIADVLNGGPCAEPLKAADAIKKWYARNLDESGRLKSVVSLLSSGHFSIGTLIGECPELVKNWTPLKYRLKNTRQASTVWIHPLMDPPTTLARYFGDGVEILSHPQQKTPPKVVSPLQPIAPPLPVLTPRFLLLDDLISGPPPLRVKNTIPSVGVGILAGDTSTGKTFIAIDFAGAVATGRDFFGHHMQKGPVVFFNSDMGLPRRLGAYAQHYGIEKDMPEWICRIAPMDLFNQSDLEELHRELDFIKPLTIVIDGLTDFFPGDPDSDKQAASILKSLAERFQCAVLVTMPSDAETPGPVFEYMAAFRMETIGTGGHRTLKIGRERYGFNLKKVADSCVIEPHRPMGMVA